MPTYSPQPALLYAMNNLKDKAIALLCAMIAEPSVSREEEKVVGLVAAHLRRWGLVVEEQGRNVLAVCSDYDASRPTLLLNSHLDTVRPAPGYTRNPFAADIEGDRLYGLGSNDAGASVVALAAAYTATLGAGRRVNTVLALTCEEEVGGLNGIRHILPLLEQRGVGIDMGIVGEPTGLNPAVGERGLVVLDCVARGRSGHAARSEGVNALYIALDDIATLRHLRFPKESELLGSVKITTTQIQAGTQHNVVPDECRFVVDVRTTDAYSNQETVELIRAAIRSDAEPRSTRIHASAIASDHPLVRAAVAAGGTPFVSPTTSDMSSMEAFPTIKLGPGDSARSHSADEFVEISQIEKAIDTYKDIILRL